VRKLACALAEASLLVSGCLDSKLSKRNSGSKLPHSKEGGRKRETPDLTGYRPCGVRKLPSGMAIASYRTPESLQVKWWPERDGFEE